MPAEPRTPKVCPMSAFILLKAFATRRSGLAGGATIPHLTATRTGVRADVGLVSRYRALCGFRNGPDTVGGPLPLTLPQMLAGPLHLELLASPLFPLPVAGVVHFENRIVERAPLLVGEAYDVSVHVEGHREDPRGVLFDIETRFSQGGEPLWEATTTVLSRPRKAAAKGENRETRSAPAPGLPGAVLRSAMFRLPADLGRRYSALAGDYNPIHLTALTAKPFGFKRAIIHGMWSLARCVAEMEDDLPPRPRVCEVRFERPVFLPSRVHLGMEREDEAGSIVFSLTSPDLKTRHLRGAIRHGADDGRTRSV